MFPAARTLAVALFAFGLALGPGASAQDDLEDVLGGFEDEVPEEFQVDGAPEGPDAAPDADAKPFVDLDGSYEFTTSINYLPHHSSSGTSYTGVSRLRNRLNLQLDFNLPQDFEVRIAGYGFGDPIYAIRGRDDFSEQVLDEYEWEVDLTEVYVHGELFEDFDIKIGRQIVIWGRSDTIRVLDVLNALDSREPGRVDIEDLRLATTMIRGDYYFGNWALTGIAIPELRFDKNPPFGSDFFIGPAPLMEVKPTASASNTEWAGSLTGIYSGWDVSFHAARIFNDTPHAVIDPSNPLGFRLEHQRIWMAGAGGNVTEGNWLFKAEFAYFGDLAFANTAETKDRIDALLGVEYYGFVDNSIALEVVTRQILDHQPALEFLPDVTDSNTQEIVLRWTGDWLNNTVHTTVVGVMFGWKAQDGGLIRLSADYDVIDAMVVGAGILFYLEGDALPLSAWGRNDRIFARAKYSF